MWLLRIKGFGGELGAAVLGSFGYIQVRQHKTKQTEMSIESDYLSNLSNIIANTKITFPKNYLEILRTSLENFQNIDFSILSKNLPYTKKSTSQTAIKYLRESYFNNKLVLVLGAGVSMKFGIPSWDSLLQRLLVKTIEEEPEKATILSKVFTKVFNPSPLIAGRFLQESLEKPNNSKNQFENEVRSALYESFDNNAHSLTMEEIVQLCISPGKNTPTLDGIISYNYDDIIENKILAKGLDVPFQSIYGQGIDPDDNSLAIYHVHGFLPREGNLDDRNIITLGEYVYHEQYNAIYSWNNIVQINKFRDNTCLFIGSSLTDPNIRRLLDIANSQKTGKKKYHYILKKKPDLKKVREMLQKVLDDNPEIFNEKIKAKINFEDTVEFLIEMQNRYEEIDSESLGVKTVWINDYDNDIANILKKIRK